MHVTNFPSLFLIRNLEFRNANILVTKHTLYICFIFPSPLRVMILFYGEYIVHLQCQWEKRVIHTKIVYIYFTQVHVYGIAYFPFFIPYRFPFRVLVTPLIWESSGKYELPLSYFVHLFQLPGLQYVLFKSSSFITSLFAWISNICYIRHYSNRWYVRRLGL